VPGDRVLVPETGHFARRWAELARGLGLEPVRLEGDWRSPADPARLERALREDGDIRAVCLVHGETSTGIRSEVAPVRAVLDRLGHPALLLVDAISTLACMPYGHDACGADVTIAASQKGFMLPPGLALLAVGPRALEARRRRPVRPGYFDWAPLLEANAAGHFPTTPATSLLFGLDEAVRMLEEEGLERVWARHARLGALTRRAVAAWGLELQGRDPTACLDSVTVVVLPAGHDAEAFRALVLERFGLALGGGLGRLRGRVFRIGHLGALDELGLLAVLAGVERGLAAAGIPPRASGVAAALELLRAGDALDRSTTSSAE